MFSSTSFSEVHEAIDGAVHPNSFGFRAFNRLVMTAEFPAEETQAEERAEARFVQAIGMSKQTPSERNESQ